MMGNSAVLLAIVDSQVLFKTLIFHLESPAAVIFPGV